MIKAEDQLLTYHQTMMMLFIYGTVTQFVMYMTVKFTVGAANISVGLLMALSMTIVVIGLVTFGKMSSATYTTPKPLSILDAKYAKYTAYARPFQQDTRPWAQRILEQDRV